MQPLGFAVRSEGEFARIGWARTFVAARLRGCVVTVRHQGSWYGSRAPEEDRHQRHSNGGTAQGSHGLTPLPRVRNAVDARPALPGGKRACPGV